MWRFDLSGRVLYTPGDACPAYSPSLDAVCRCGDGCERGRPSPGPRTAAFPAYVHKGAPHAPMPASAPPSVRTTSVHSGGGPARRRAPRRGPVHTDPRCRPPLRADYSAPPRRGATPTVPAGWAAVPEHPLRPCLTTRRCTRRPGRLTLPRPRRRLALPGPQTGAENAQTGAENTAGGGRPGVTPDSVAPPATRWRDALRRRRPLSDALSRGDLRVPLPQRR